MVHLCVNIDHIATVRNARGESEPDPLHAAVLCELAGAAGITFHLREDRRHIMDEDAHALRRVTKGILNMEMACTDEMLNIALAVHPDQVTLVPEKREELTTEGGLDVAGQLARVTEMTHALMEKGIAVSHFIEPDEVQVHAAQKSGASHVEFHTGVYARHFDRNRQKALQELDRLQDASSLAHGAGLVVNAGHGLNYRNVTRVARIPFMTELNIGHAIVGRALFHGLERAVRDMVDLIRQADHPAEED
ncbi:MAG: pyridoxine 5'-phosphate synthase [Candidatus Sumerlaeia bacterium]|nr:pyridoxine 5'-phosphate synthase [Candidatus Sumerlaeia bacterium]